MMRFYGARDSQSNTTILSVMVDKLVTSSYQFCLCGCMDIIAVACAAWMTIGRNCSDSARLIIIFTVIIHYHHYQCHGHPYHNHRHHHHHNHSHIIDHRHRYFRDSFSRLEELLVLVRAHPHRLKGRSERGGRGTVGVWRAATGTTLPWRRDPKKTHVALYI